MKFSLRKTNRGFSVINFVDCYDVACSVQESSLATERAIWIGCDDANPRHLVPGLSWQSVPLPDGTVMSSRMHLTQDQVRELLPILQVFADTGEVVLAEPICDNVTYHDK